MQIYKVNFASMTQVCLEYPTRKREVRQFVDQDVRLTRSQQQAIKYSENMARDNFGPALVALKNRMHKLTGSDAAFDELDAWMRHSVPIIIHTKLTSPLIDKYLDDEYYRNIFEVLAGRGCTDLGARGGWEKRVFGFAFESCDVHERPKYGCLNLTNDPKGVPYATQYGTSFFVLKHSIRWRCTFTSRDSSCKDSQPGTARQFASIFEEGPKSELTDDDLLKVVRHSGEEIPFYKEVQIHGPVRFSHDIERLVADEDLTPTDKQKVGRFAELHRFPVSFQRMHKAKGYDYFKGGNV